MAKRGTLTPRRWVQMVGDDSFGGAYLVYGPDEYIKGETVRRVLSMYIPAEQHGFGISRLFGAQTDAGQILQAAQAVPMLGERVAAVVHDTQKLAAPHKARLPDALQPLAHPSLLIFLGPAEIDRRTRFYKWFVDQGRAVFCEPLSQAQAESFARRKLQESGKRLSGDDVIVQLVELTGPHAGVIDREIEKLALYVGDREQVTADDVLEVTGHTAGVQVDELVPEILAGRRIRALHRARQIQAAGVDGGALVSRLAQHFFDLRRAELAGTRQPWQLAKNLRLPGSRAEQLSTWLSQSSPAALQASTRHIAHAEALLRSGRVESAAVTDALILALTPAAPAKPAARP